MSRFTIQAYYEMLYTDVDVEANSEVEAINIMNDRVKLAMRRLTTDLGGSFNARIRRIIKPIEQSFDGEGI